MGNLPTQEIVGLLQVGRTIAEIARHFKISEDVAQKITTQRFDGYYMMPSVNESRELIFRLVPLAPPKTTAERVWRYAVAKDEKGLTQPYIQVHLPENIPGKKVKIYLVADIHYGAKGHNSCVFEALLKHIGEKEHAFFVGVGDWLENTLASSVAGAIYDQILPPDAQIKEFREKMRPLAHKCLVCMPGNHEDRTIKVAGIDQLEYGICEPLGIPYIGEPIYLDVFWRNKLFTFFVQHGRSGAQTKGGKLNAAARPLATSGFTMFAAMGHVHDPASVKNQKRCVEFKRDGKGEIVGMDIVQREEYVVICGSSYRYFGTYGARAGYSPTPPNIVPICVFEDNGKYYLDEKPIKL